MGQSKTLDVRQRAAVLRSTGLTFSQIALELKISLRTAKNWLKRYQTEGETGLIARYKNCGCWVKAEDEKSFRLVRLIKNLHPTWGVPFILVKIKDKYPELKMQSIRHYQRRLSVVHDHMPKEILPKPSVERSRTAHDCWQIDAKERLVLQDGQRACYLTITDEATGAILAAESFPPLPD
jgi:DNA-binding CsgD family transcriptional regulator